MGFFLTYNTYSKYMGDYKQCISFDPIKHNISYRHCLIKFMKKYKKKKLLLNNDNESLGYDPSFTMPSKSLCKVFDTLYNVKYFPIYASATV